MMSKLRFDPVTYQFYYRCSLEDSGPAKAAGFGWDPLRRRYYTLDPKVAAGLASCADNYAKLLLADTLGDEPLCEPPNGASRSRRWSPATASISISSNALH
jgi:hypothetical protein